MKRTLRIILATLGLIAIAGAVIGIIVTRDDASQAASPPTKTLELFEPEGQFQSISDIGAKGFSPGDSILENIEVLDPATQRKVGETVTDIRVVRVIGEDVLFYIDCTVMLDGGRIVFEGAGRFSELEKGVTLAVTGGSGAYARALGTIVVKGSKLGEKKGFSFSFSYITS